MQRPAGGYRGGMRIAHQNSSIRHLPDENHQEEDENRLRLSDSNSDIDNGDDDEDSGADDDGDGEGDETQQKSGNSFEIKKPSSLYSKINQNGDLESAIRNLRPLATHQTRTKTVFSISHQKADLPQLNSVNESNLLISSSDGHKSDETSQQETKSKPWFPKADVGHVDSDAFIRHNHVEPQNVADVIEPSEPPAILTTIPPVNVSARPTAKIAPPGQSRSGPILFPMKVSTPKPNEQGQPDEPFFSMSSTSNGDDLQPKKTTLVHTPSSAFQPIQNLTHRHASSSSSSPKISVISLDIPQHKLLERGQRLKNVHISHPQGPVTVHLMLSHDFATACRLLGEMAKHPELQLDSSPKYPFKPQLNRVCACFHEGRWFRCRILQISSDGSTASVIYLDWGMTASLRIGPNFIRRLPHEFYNEPACCIVCRLNGVFESQDLVSSETIAQCLSLLSENEYDVVIDDVDHNNNIQVTIFHQEECINHKIKQLLEPRATIKTEDELIEQFRHELQLNVGDEFKALLSSFSGKDDSFYVLLVNRDTLAIDKAMSEFQSTSVLRKSSGEPPRIKTIVAARYADDRKCYRAWVKSVSYDRQTATVFFVDFGNESSVDFCDIYPCPDTVKYLPWLGIRIRLVNENMSYDELVHFWKVAESNYIWIKILDIFTDCYGVQIKLDYTVFLRHERLKRSPQRFAHIGIQTNIDNGSLPTKCPSISSDIHTSSITPSVNDQTWAGNEALLRNLFEMITKELRHLRHRINDSDETSQDRHNQLMQLLISSLNLNNSNNSKKL